MRRAEAAALLAADVAPALAQADDDDAAAEAAAANVAASDAEASGGPAAALHGVDAPSSSGASASGAGGAVGASAAGAAAAPFAVPDYDALAARVAALAARVGRHHDATQVRILKGWCFVITTALHARADGTTRLLPSVALFVSRCGASGLKQAVAALMRGPPAHGCGWEAGLAPLHADVAGILRTCAKHGIACVFACTAKSSAWKQQ